MRTRFTQSFKIQAVEKALTRTESTNIVDIAESLGVGYSTLQKWIAKSRNQAFSTVSGEQLSGLPLVTKEKRPQDWSQEDRLNLVIRCASLDEEALGALCRQQGLYPHHVKQWRGDFVSGETVNSKANNPSEVKVLRAENKALKKELNRKDKALAETAALLVLQKKVRAIWEEGEDDSR